MISEFWRLFVTNEAWSTLLEFLFQFIFSLCSSKVSWAIPSKRLAGHTNLFLWYARRAKNNGHSGAQVFINQTLPPMFHWGTLPYLIKVRYHQKRAYIVCGKDKVMEADLQHWLVKDIGVAVMKEIKDTGHMAMLSKCNDHSLKNDLMSSNLGRNRRR